MRPGDPRGDFGAEPAVIRRALIAVMLACLCATSARAHEVRPGLVELTEIGPQRYAFVWKRPSGGEVELQLAPVMPKECRLVTPGREQLAPDAVTVRGTLECPGGVAGKRMEIAGLEATITDVLVRVHHKDGRLESHLVRPVDPGVTFGGGGSMSERALGYAQIGLQHILLGADHLLFLIGLMLIVADRWMLVKTLTAFTVAHSLALAVAALGYVSAPLLPLNGAIALSILFLGPEIVRAWRRQTSFTIRHPWVVAFAFGLLHGFGFASGLTELGLPADEIPLALLLFNLGVEAGQLLLVALVVLLERSFRVLQVRWPLLMQRLPGYLVGSLGAFWTLQRALPLFGSGPLAVKPATRAFVALLICSPALASAHVESGSAVGFLAGLHHPVSGMDHLLAMIAVGLWGAQLGMPALWLLPLTFPLVMAFGGALGLMGVPLPGAEIGIALSAFVLGLAILTAWRPGLWVAAAIVGCFAIFHGHAHGTELPAGASGLAYSLGFVIATGTLHAAGIGIGLIHRWRVGRIALRAAGAAVAAAGGLFMWQALA